MTKKEAVRLASRTLALLLVVWALSDLSYIPTIAFSLSRYRIDTPLTPMQQHNQTYYLVQLALYIIRGAGYFASAVWLYRCGPSVEAFLSPVEETDGK